MSSNGNENWAQDIPRKRFSTPYNLKEDIIWIKNFLFGPSRRFSNITKFIPQKIELNKISIKIKLGFIGDIMRMGKRSITYDRNLIDFLNVDYLIGNFEGTISKGKKVFFAQDHSEKIIDDLKKLFPPNKFILTCANNHSGDFGWTEFNKSYELLKENGFITIGRRDQPSFLLNEQVNITNVSNWSNQPCNYISYLKDIDQFNVYDNKFNILCPHWGYEMQLYPNPRQIELGKKILKKWDLIIGTHPHVPQPITTYKLDSEKKLIVYSLGNFCSCMKYKKLLNGLVVKINLGNNKAGKWQIGKVEWKFLKICHIDKLITKIELVDDCKYFKKIEINN